MILPSSDPGAFLYISRSCPALGEKSVRNSEIKRQWFREGAPDTIFTPTEEALLSYAEAQVLRRQTKERFTDPDPLGLYKVLALPIDAEHGIISKKVRDGLLRAHPDKVRAHGEVYNKYLFLKLSQARYILTNPEHRRMYDIMGIDGMTMFLW